MTRLQGTNVGITLPTRNQTARIAALALALMVVYGAGSAHAQYSINKRFETSASFPTTSDESDEFAYGCVDIGLDWKFCVDEGRRHVDVNSSNDYTPLLLTIVPMKRAPEDGAEYYLEVWGTLHCQAGRDEMAAFLGYPIEEQTNYIDHHACPIKRETPWGETRCPAGNPYEIELTVRLDQKIYETGGDLLNILPCDWF